MSSREQCLVLALTIVGGVLQLYGVARVFGELRKIVDAAATYEKGRRISSARSRADEMRRRSYGGDPGPSARWVGDAQQRLERLVKKLIDKDSRRHRAISAWLILGGLFLSTLGAELSVARS